MEDERGGGASVVEAAQKLGLTAVTIDAVDRSGRTPDGQPVANIPRGLDVVSQAFNSDVGVDNDPIQFNGGYVWYDVLGITPSRERTLDEVKDQVEASWRDDQIASRLRTKATEMVQKLEQGGKLAERGGGGRARRSKPPRTSSATPPCPACPSSADHGGVPHRQGWRRPDRGRRRQRMDRVPRHRRHVPPVDLASDDIKKLKETLQRGLSDEQVAQYVDQARTDHRHHHQPGRLRAGDGREHGQLERPIVP